MDLELLIGTKATNSDIEEVKNKFNPSNISSLNIIPYNIYSTTEHVVGQWIDGKTLYEKTVVCSTPAKDTDSYIPIGATIDTVVDYSAMFKNTPLNDAGVNNWIKASSQAMKMGVTNVEGVNVHIRGNDSTDGNQNTIHIRHNATNWGTKPLYVTIRYTKVS